MSDDVLRTWLTYQGSTKDDPKRISPEHAWAYEQLDALLRSSPEEGWAAVLSLITLADSDWRLACVAAGPLEDLLSQEPERFKDRVDECARRDPKFRRCLSGVWLSDDSPLREIVRKYVATVADPL